MTDSTEQQAVTVVQLQALQDWLREPDHAEHFGTSQLVEWINRRPTHIVPAVLARLAATSLHDMQITPAPSLPCKSGEGAGEREAIARVIDPNAWDHADFRASKGFEENERITRPSLMTADRILALRTDATQTREAELVRAVKDDLRGLDGEEYTDSGMEDAFFRWPVVERALRAALNARGGA